MNQTEYGDDDLIRIAEVKRKTGLGRSTIYRRIKAGTFPAPRDAGGGLSGWRLSEVKAWVLSRPKKGMRD